MDENIVDFEDYNIKIDLREIDNMDKEEVKKCMDMIEKIKKILNKK